ncbi:MAG: hypothetical protein JWP63_917 [Candidatus Solibacter sp.]|jgi:thiosulfate reductase cytochrome b subunit|nr:hypothetical protein [Candidatus Solibacter sp.]
MADSVYSAALGIRDSRVSHAPRHSLVVRITHWTGTLSFVALVISGFGIILSHPRFYWGETGGVGTPSLFDLPLPFMLGGPSGWGRYLHFQTAWVWVANLVIYVVSGMASRHFQNDLLPAKGASEWRRHLRFERPRPEEAHRYNVVQRITYLAVIFGLFPLLIWTGLAMSPALTSVWPWLVTMLGGHQSARTIHFFAAVALTLFVVVHVVMVWRAGFRQRVGAMITGNVGDMKEDA